MKRAFPVLGTNPQSYVDWSMLSEEWALKIHSQTLERLAERGGLSRKEIYGNVNNIPYYAYHNITEEQGFNITHELWVIQGIFKL